MSFPTVTTNPVHKSVNQPIVTANGTVLAANFGRRDGLIQNLGTTPLYVKKGPDCSATDFTVILSGGEAEDDGLGASLPLAAYSGVVSVFSATAPRCIVSEDVG